LVFILNFFATLLLFDSSYTEHSTSDNSKSGGIESAAHNTSGRKAGYLSPPCAGLHSNVLWVAFSILPGSLSLVKYLYILHNFTFYSVYIFFNSYSFCLNLLCSNLKYLFYISYFYVIELRFMPWFYPILKYTGCPFYLFMPEDSGIGNILNIP
jgi:hypothetical protein